MKKTPIIAGLIALLALSCAAQNVVTPAMAGHWEGNARIIVSWCSQTNLSVKVDIHTDGTVTGAVGDAKLKDGRFQRNRGWLLRKLNWATDYLIMGGLDGPIVKAEDVTRSKVMMPLNFNDGTFEGGVNTSGTLFGGKAHMPFTASGLHLARSQ